MFTIVINQFHLVRRSVYPLRGTTQITGIVGDSGQVYLSGLPLQGIINIQWGESSYQQCRANYQLPESELDNAISYANLECR